MYEKFLRIPCNGITLMIAPSVMATPIGYGEHWVRVRMLRLIYGHEANVTTRDLEPSDNWCSLAGNNTVDSYDRFNREHSKVRLDSLGDKNSHKSESSIEYLRS